VRELNVNCPHSVSKLDVTEKKDKVFCSNLNTLKTVWQANISFDDKKKKKNPALISMSVKDVLCGPGKVASPFSVSIS
jgi:hypothetical protein